MVKLFDEAGDNVRSCDRICEAFMEFLMAKYRRKLNKGEVIDLDILAEELRSIEEARND